MEPRICREGILKLKPYIPGKPIEEVEREYGVKDIIKLASNENPLGASPKAVEAINRMAWNVGLYPDGSCYVLRNTVAEKLGVKPDNLTFGAGSDEVIHVIALALLERGDEVISCDPTFVQYEAAAVLCECAYHKVPLKNHTYDLEGIAEKLNAHTKLVFIANPNNPTGTMVTHAEVERLLSRMPERAVLVLDEAYYEYNERSDFPRSVEWVLEGRNVIVLRTFSKIYGLAGLRVGYGIARPDIIGYLEQVRQPFNVSSIGQAAATASLDDYEHVERSRRLNTEGRRYLYREFDRLGLPYVPSEANFVWVDLKEDSVRVFKELLRRGVIIRTGDIFGMPTWARVTVGKPEENKRFIAALEEVIASLHAE